jgi:hypothetical protein
MFVSIDSCMEVATAMTADRHLLGQRLLNDDLRVR